MSGSPNIELQIHPVSGLSFPWAFDGSMNLSAGGDGVAWSEVMQINWEDLETALQQLLGYSYRVDDLTSGVGVAQIKRKLPWQHPYFNQLWVKNVAEVRGLGPPRANSFETDDFNPTGMGVGSGTPLNMGPWSDYDRARITIQFWRPPYFVRSDIDIQDDNGVQQEWLRYVSKAWSQSQQILSRESAQMVWCDGTSNANGLPGGLGQVVSHQKLTRTWYEVPEACLFGTAQDTTPNGQLYPLSYTRTDSYNPVTGYFYAGGPNTYTTGQNPINATVNLPIGNGSSTLASCQTQSGNPQVTVISTAGLFPQGAICEDGTPYSGDMVSSGASAVIRPGSTIISIDDNTHFTMNFKATASATLTLRFVSDHSISNRLFGCPMGTLRFDNAEIHQRNLQLPPYLMQIPFFSNNEAISQVQYDVVMHFDLFDPPRQSTAANVYPYGANRGHNMMPYPGTGMWRGVRFQQDNASGTTGPFFTPFNYACLDDLFRVI